MNGNDNDVNRLILGYLRKRGFKEAEASLRKEAGPAIGTSEEGVFALNMSIAAAGGNDLSVVSHKLLLHTDGEGDPRKVIDGYRGLRDWVHGSLDNYRDELLRVLFPVLAHSFVELVANGFAAEAKELIATFKADHERLHGPELLALEGLASPQHLREAREHAGGVVGLLRSRKVVVRMSAYAQTLLLAYLQSTGTKLLIALVNQWVTLAVVGVHPGVAGADDGEDDAELFHVTGERAEARFLVDRVPQLRLGLLRDGPESRAEAALAEEQQAAMGGGGGAGPVANGGDKLAVDAKSAKKAAKADAVAAAAARAKVAAPIRKGPFASVPRDDPSVPLPRPVEEAERALRNELRRRVALGASAGGALPSTVFFTFLHSSAELACCTVDTAAARVVGGYADGAVRVWDFARGGTPGGLPDGAGAGGAGDANVPAPPPGGPKSTTLVGHVGAVYGVSLSPDSQLVVSAGGDGTARVWSLELSAPLASYRAGGGGAYPVWDVSWGPLGTYFATASHDRTARVWSLERAGALRAMVGHLGDVDAVAWHPNCGYLATASCDRTARLWDVATGHSVRVFAGHKSPLTALAVSPDGRCLATAAADGDVVTWDMASGRRLATLPGHAGAVWSLAYSTESSLLASGGADCTVRLWDLAAAGKAQGGALAKTLYTRATPVHAVRFTRANLLMALGPLSTS